MSARSRHDEEAGERTRLLKKDNDSNASRGQDSHQDAGDDENEVEEVGFAENDEQDPKNWPLSRKYLNVFVIFSIALCLPMISSILAPALDDIATAFGTSKMTIIGAQTGFVCMLGIGPLFLAPMSETFGRRKVFLINLVIFTILEIPIALCRDVYSFLILRTLSGLFGSVGVANGGGSISDMFKTNERATVLGFYLLGPLLGPTIGPFAGGMITSSLNWRWLFWFSLVLAAVVTAITYFCLQETNAKTILAERKQKLEKEHQGQQYKVQGESDQSVFAKIAGNSTRACKILFYQPAVLIMSAYQALVFSTMYSLYTNYSSIFSSPPYNFSDEQVAVAYLAPAVGFILTAFIVVPFIDKIYNKLAQEKNNGEGKPEYRLPLANIGAFFLPISLFWFGWSIQTEQHWAIVLASTLFFGASQVSIFNTVQNYYIDSFESMAASALAAGAFLRSMVGGIVPLFVPQMFDKLGYGWGMSVFGIISVLLMPAPLLFFFYGAKLREKYKLDL